MTSSAVRWTWCATWLLGGALSGCVTEQVNHCLDAPNMVGCPELCLEDPTWEHCSLVDPSQFVEEAGVCGTCTVNYPFCDAATTTCVECTEANGCECWRDEPCGAGAPVCIANQCKACINDTSCDAFATAPICDDGTGGCRGCAEDGECAGFVDTPVCDEASGACVECTVDSEETTCPAAPGEDVGPACDPVAFTCTGALRGSLGFCQACISDSECGSAVDYGTYRCVPVPFQGAPHGNYCALDLATHRAAIGDGAAVCPERQPAAVTLTSIGVEEADYCLVRTAVTTCEAVLALGNSCGGDDACGVVDLADGICRDGQCTYQCNNDRDCFGGSVAPGDYDVCNGVGVTTCDPN